MANIQKYGSYDIEAAEKEQQELDSEGGGDYLKLAAGKNVVRFLPPTTGGKPFRVVHQHYVNAPEGGLVVVACPRMEAKKPCIICNKANALRSSGNPSDRDAGYKLLPKRRVFANVIDRKNPEAGPRVLAFGKTIHEQLIALRRDEDAGGDFTNPDQGFDIIIERAGSGIDTKYSVMAKRTVTPLGNLDWLDMQHDLERFALLLSPEQLKTKLKDAGADDIIDVTPTPAPTGKGSTRGGSGRAMADDDSDDE